MMPSWISAPVGEIVMFSIRRMPQDINLRNPVVAVREFGYEDYRDRNFDNAMIYYVFKIERFFLFLFSFLT
jgi:hypothetical protein